jgi:hypothetical protein
MAKIEIKIAERPFTNDDRAALANWLAHMRNGFEFIRSDSVVQDHLSFLTRSEAWVRSNIGGK